MPGIESRKKIPASRLTSRGLIRDYLARQIPPNDPSPVLPASETAGRNRISFRDALVAASASNAGADRALSEDLNDGRMIEGVVIESPFSCIKGRGESANRHPAKKPAGAAP